MSNTAYSDLKAAWHLDKIAAMRDGEQVVPAQVQLILSDLCNQDCHFCLTSGAMVDTLSGHKSIADIKVGDLVWGPDGQPQRVTATSSRVVHQVYRISVGGSSIDASEEHPLLREDGWTKAGAIGPGDGAVVRLRLRASGEATPQDLELVRRNASAKAWGFDGWTEEDVRADEDRQPDEEGGCTSQGVGYYNRPIQAEIDRRVEEYLGCSPKAYAVGQEPDAESGASSQVSRGISSSSPVKNGTPIRAMGEPARSTDSQNRVGFNVDRSSQPGLPSRRSEEVLGGFGKGVFRGVHQGAQLDELRRSDSSPLSQEEVGLSCGVCSGVQVPFAESADSSHQGLRIAGISLERGLAVRQVDSVLVIPGQVTVYNFSCGPLQAYEANGFVVHNCSYRMSNGLSSEQFAGPNGERNPNRRIPTEKAMEILNDCASLGVKSVQLTGGGEPTAHPDHLAIFEYAQTLGLETALVTNGIIFRPGWENVLPKMKWVRVSIDAGTPEEYARVRRVKPEFYATAIGHIAMLAAEIKKQGTDCLLGVGYVITRENWADVYEGVRILRETGAANVRLSAMFSTEGASYYDGIYDDIKAEIVRVKTLETPEFAVIDLFGDRIADLVQHAPDYDFCGYQQLNCYVGGNLKVYRCCTTAYTLHGEVGDLTNQTFAEWFYSSEKKWKYQSFNARSCSVCQFGGKNKTILYMVGQPQHVNFV